ncbi:uncharacterized protein LOC121051003 [Rosa chinensis]|nr:uncharacterized protein LOC121051003 [Rosa chinensis]
MPRGKTRTQSTSSLPPFKRPRDASSPSSSSIPAPSSIPTNSSMGFFDTSILHGDNVILADLINFRCEELMGRLQLNQKVTSDLFNRVMAHLDLTFPSSSSILTPSSIPTNSSMGFFDTSILHSASATLADLINFRFEELMGQLQLNQRVASDQFNIVMARLDLTSSYSSSIPTPSNIPINSSMSFFDTSMLHGANAILADLSNFRFEELMGQLLLYERLTSNQFNIVMASLDLMRAPLIPTGPSVVPPFGDMDANDDENGNDA